MEVVETERKLRELVDFQTIRIKVVILGAMETLDKSYKIETCGAYFGEN